MTDRAFRFDPEQPHFGFAVWTDCQRLEFGWVALTKPRLSRSWEKGRRCGCMALLPCYGWAGAQLAFSSPIDATFRAVMGTVCTSIYAKASAIFVPERPQSVAGRVLKGEHRRLMLVNRAIEDYRKHMQAQAA